MAESFRVGSLVYATDSGLGILARSFHLAGVVTDVLVIRHGRYPTHTEWYPGAGQITDLHSSDDQARMRVFCQSMDAMLFFETPFVWELIPHCRTHNVRTFLCPMYECLPPVKDLPYQPDHFLCPSLLDLQYFPDRSVFLPVPVDTTGPLAVTWRQRDRARVFVHNAGHGGLRGRNGTRELMESWEHVQSPARLIVHSQSRLHNWSLDERVEWCSGDLPRERLYSEGDVFLFPEKFNGLSLPLQEARASGMLVMSTNRFPMNTWLPQVFWPPDLIGEGGGREFCSPEGYGPPLPVLIEPEGFTRAQVARRCVEFDEAIVSPRKIAEMVDLWYDRDISEYSLMGREWARANSWEVWKPRYLEVLGGGGRS